MKLNKSEEKPELLMFHGTKDTVVHFEWGKISYENLASTGIKGKFIQLDSADHEMVPKEINFAKEWIMHKLK